MVKKIFWIAMTAALGMTGCKKDPVETPTQGGKGTILIGTTVKNADGASGSSYIQLVNDLSGSIDNSNTIPSEFGVTPYVFGKDLFMLPTMVAAGTQELKKYTYTASQTLEYVGKMQLPPASGAMNIVKVNDQKAYIANYLLGTVWIFNPQTMEKTGEIDLTPYAHKDASPDPAQGIIRDGKYFLPLNQIDANWQPYGDHLQTDVAVIDVATDRVEKIISETTSGISFPTRPMLRHMIFTDEANDIYIACSASFGLGQFKKNGFVCIPAGSTEFDPAKTWEISEVAIQGSEYKSAAVLNTKYLGGGKVAAYVAVSELNGENPYTSRSSMAVLMDLKAKTIKKIEGIPYTDGHSLWIDTYKGKTVFSAYGEKAAGFFICNMDGSGTHHAMQTVGNATFMHVF